VETETSLAQINYPIGTDGFNYSKNLNKLSPSCMVNPSYNFNLLPNSIRARGGTKILYNLNEKSPITSLTQIYNKYDNESIISTTQSGKIFKNDFLLKKLPNVIYDATYLTWNGTLLINNSFNIPQGWDGISETTEDFPESNMADDWILDQRYPTVMVSYGKGNSVRAWAIGDDRRKNTLYFSSSDNGLDTYPNFKNSDSGFFYISTPNEEPLTAITSFGDRLIVFSKTKAYIIDDANIDSTLWGYTEAQWKGGANSNHVVMQTENDIFSLMPDGTIYSITAVMEYGDYKISSITESAQINDYMYDKINKSYMNNMHAVFDPSLRVIKYFCTSSNVSENNIALCYFIDKTPSTGWSIHRNSTFKSGYNAKSSCIYKDSITQHTKTITGDYNGRIWELETNIVVDDNNPFEMVLTTPLINLNDIRNTKRFKRGFLEILTSNVINVDIHISTNDFIKSYFYSSILFKGSRFGSAKWNVDKFTVVPIYKLKYPINKIGIGLQQSFSFYSNENILCGKFNQAKWNEGYIFGVGILAGEPFYLMSNMLDVLTISNRISME